MKVTWLGLQLIFATIGGWLGWFLGGIDGILYTLIAFVATDYITGVMCAILDRKLSSKVGFSGIFKKALIFIMVGIGHTIDRELIGDGSAIRTAIIFFYVSNEGISLLENATLIGLPIPNKVKEILFQLKEKE